MKPRQGRSIHLPGVTHGQAPIPMGARVGNMIYSSALLGKDPSTDTLPADGAAQMQWLFHNLRSFLAHAGATLDGVVHVTAYLRDNSLREALNAQWVACFPDPDDRPARHTHLNPDMPGAVLAQLEIVAVAQDGR
jgi:2-iminobutanoate/2-iminopropanoate deaminase